MRFRYLLQLALTLSVAVMPAKADNTIRIIADSAMIKYNHMIFGHFIEHFHTQIYGGIYDPGSNLNNS